MGNSFRFRVLAIIILFVLVTVAGVFAAVTADSVDYSSCTSFGSGTKDDPYRIYSGAQIIDISNKPAANGEDIFAGKYFEVQNDISTNLNVKESAYPFKGIIDGKGHSLKFPKVVFDSLGEGGIIKNFNLKTSKTPSSFGNYSFIETVEENALIENCTMDYTCFIDSNIIKKQLSLNTLMKISAFSAYNYGTIRNCTINFSLDQNTVGSRININRCEIQPWAIYGTGKLENCTIDFNDCVFDISDYSVLLNGTSNLDSYNSTVKGNVSVHSTQTDLAYCFNFFCYPLGLQNKTSYCINSMNLTVHYREDLKDYLTFSALSEESINCVYDGDLIKLGTPKG